ncbi:MAG TPA: sigma-70 family RNA polymerase sigma factor, partial [Calidithermus sp.]|nr:sigma-70 family RNA polymerase sigma factor [Calidithermus sp.]
GRRRPPVTVVRCGRRGAMDRSDAAWLEALRADDERAWSDLRGRVVAALLGWLRDRGASGEGLDGLVDDATQDTLLTVRAKLDTFRGDSRFATWVYRIAVNTLLGELRRRRWPREQPLPATDEAGRRPLLDAGPDPQRAAEQHELWAEVRALIDEALTPHQRAILLAHVFDRAPLDVVAAAAGLSRDAAYKVIHDARRKLRAALLARGVTPERTRRVLDG